MADAKLVRFLERNSNRQHWESAHSGLVHDIINKLPGFLGYTPDHIYTGVQLENGSPSSVGLADIY